MHDRSSIIIIEQNYTLSVNITNYQYQLSEISTFRYQQRYQLSATYRHSNYPQLALKRHISPY